MGFLQLAACICKATDEAIFIGFEICLIFLRPDVELVKQLLSKPKVSVEAKEPTFGFTPIHFAARLGSAWVSDHLAKLLLPRKASLDAKNKNGLEPWGVMQRSEPDLAVKREVATTLIAAKATVGVQDVDGRTEAMWAAKHGHSEALAVLLDKGFDLNISDKFGLAVADHAQDHLHLRLALLEAEQRNQALLKAAQRPGTRRWEAQALEEGAYVDARDDQGWTALVWSMMGCCVDLVIVLAQHSADPNVLNECSEVLDHLHLQGDQVRRALEASGVVKAELDVGAQVNSQTTEQLFTSLIFAAAHCNYQGAVMLIGRKANVHLTDLTGWSALHYAVQSGSLEMVSMLSAAKANLAQPTFDGTTTMHLAVNAHCSSQVQLLYAGKVELNTNNSKSSCPVQEAARWGCAESLQVLLAYRANPRVKDSKGRSLLAISVAAGRNEAASALLRPLPNPAPLVPPENERGILLRRRYLQAMAERAQRARKKEEEALKAEREAAEKAALQAELERAVREDEKRKAQRTMSERGEQGDAALLDFDVSELLSKVQRKGKGKPSDLPGPPVPPGPVTDRAETAPRESSKAASKSSEVERILVLFTAGFNHGGTVTGMCGKRCRSGVLCKMLKVAIAGGPERFTAADAKGRLPVHVAALSRRLDTMSLLLDLEADVNACDSEGNTPLQLVARTDDRWMVEVLLTYGADPELTNSKGETCFAFASQVMKDYINKWVQQKRFRGLVEFPLPPSPLHALYRVRVDCIPMLMYQEELEEQVLSFFAKLEFEKPLRVIVPRNPIHGWPLGFCYADYAEKQHALDICKAAKVEGIFMQRRRLNLTNQGAHYQYKENNENQLDQTQANKA
ncbi:Ankyrin-1 (ANK-1) (Ankyrin-R) (Erythrocyte ankyrin) [Durusdinium trenchii]|uniref:Ankyrin-1 (ANK-1) (Ankyrin-R) (Erythrocyte ankyrin) n=1 Tax=Durusdinium trenchii TaxID=1381693 RepID=A0ABP0QHP2_9DINO